jgi:hypothetical protein
LFWLTFSAESTPTTLAGDTDASRPVIPVDFSDHFEFAGSKRDVDCQLPEFVDHYSVSEAWSQEE